MEEEIMAINKNQIWTLCDLPTNKRQLNSNGCLKQNLEQIARSKSKKAQLVVKGYTQQARIELEETFSPVARFEMVWIFLTLAAQQQWYVY